MLWKKNQGRTGLPSPVQMKVKDAKCYYCLSERNLHTKKLNLLLPFHLARLMTEGMQVWGTEESSLGSLLQDVLIQKQKDVADLRR